MKMKHLGTKIIETENLLLRKYVLNDAEDIFNNIMSDKEITQNPHKTIEQTKDEINNWIKKYKETNYYEWAIELKNKKKIIGLICTINVNEQTKSCEIAYTISQKYWNKGYATEALYYVLRFLINDVGYNRIQGGHLIDNPASGRVMEKAGMKYEGTLRQDTINWKTGKLIDSKIYSIIKDDIK
jgi:ribosomal-protein-alanine N-acetyltransferase